MKRGTRSKQAVVGPTGLCGIEAVAIGLCGGARGLPRLESDEMTEEARASLVQSMRGVVWATLELGQLPSPQYDQKNEES